MINTIMLRQEMAKKHVTVKELAAHLGLHRSTLYRKFSGDHQFSVAEAVEVIRLLGLPPDTAARIFFVL